MTAREQMSVSLTLNGEAIERTVPAATTLLDFLRVHAGLTGTKAGCDMGECGSCTVLVDGEPLLACLVLAVELDGRAVTTIEDRNNDAVAALQRAFVAEAGLQCGFCTPGFIMAASVLKPGASDEEIRAGLAGNVCRCTGYTKIVAAVQRAQRTRESRGKKSR